MNYDPTRAQQRFLDELERFIVQELNPQLTPDQRDAPFNRGAWQRCADEGLLRWRVPTAQGGLGLDLSTAVLGYEAFGKYCSDVSFSYAFSAHSWSLMTALIEFADDAQQRYLQDVMSGGRIGAFAMTEADAGSDTAAIQSRAVRDGDEYVLNGSKAYITLAPVADFTLVFASTDPSRGAWGISAFLVDRDAPGVHAGDPDAKIGLAGAPLGPLTLTDCRVPASARVGAEGSGTSIFAHIMELERAFILAFTLGIMSRQLDSAVDYARTRHQFGQPIGKLQSVANRIVAMKTRLELARLLVYKVAWLKEQNRPAQLESAMAKAYLAEAFTESSLDALKTRGAAGYLESAGIGDELMTAVAGLLYGGTTDIQRVVVARCLGL